MRIQRFHSTTSKVHYVATSRDVPLNFCSVESFARWVLTSFFQSAALDWLAFTYLLTYLKDGFKTRPTATGQSTLNCKRQFKGVIKKRAFYKKNY